MVPRRLAVAALLALLVVLLARTAWLCDDAFITLRTVDQLVHGNGLVWNLGERVQVYTHPLWMFLLSGVYLLSRDPLVTFHVAGALATAGFLAVLVAGHGRGRWGLVLALAAAASSKAFVEFSSSGLENPLTHLLIAATWWAHLGSRAPEERLGRVALLSSLVALNRLDAVLLVAPALGVDAWRSARSVGLRRALGPLALGLLPILAWECFSLFYYGFPFPNTAYAKLSTGVPRGWYLHQGLHYWRATALADPPTLAVLALGLGVAAWTRTWSAVAALVVHAAYVVWVGGDFMVGRFLTPAVALALVLIARAPRIDARAALAGAAVFLALGLVRPYSPLRAGLDYPGGPGWRWDLGRGVADERAFYYPYTGLLRSPSRGGPTAHPWAQAGREAGERFERGEKGAGFAAFDTIGMYGYYTDLRVHVVDAFALADPLLSRLPVEHPLHTRIGHFRRAVPAGYGRTLLSGEDHVVDPDLARYYAALHAVVSGPLWSAERLREIWSVNLGGAHRALRRYLAR